MRWKHNEAHEDGEECLVLDKFLWIPKTINDETRWLEWASYTQKYLDTLGWVDWEWYDWYEKY